MIGYLGSWSSIIGLIISFITLVFAFFINRKVKKIKKRVMFNTRITPLLKDLKSYTRNINQLYQDFGENTNELKVEMAKCRVQLESVVPKLQNEHKGEFKSLILFLNNIQKYKLGNKPEGFKQIWYRKKTVFKTHEDIWELYVMLIACVNKLDNLISASKKTTLNL